jgi:hypothetical protein
VRLPDGLRAYYSEVNGQHISWTLPETDVMGWSTVSDLASFLSGRVTGYVDGASRTDAPFYSKTLDPARQRALDEHFVFERVYADSFVLVPRASMADAPSLVLLEYPDRLTPLDLSFDAYLDALFENRAQLDWQQRYRTADAVVASPTLAARTSPYRERLDDLVARIKANKRLELVRLDRYPLPPSNAFRKIAATFRSELPRAFVDFYSTVNGFRLLWRTRPGVTPQASGVLDFPPLERAFGGEHPRLTVDWDDFVTRGALWTDELAALRPDDHRALHDKRPLDRHTGRTQILMQVANGRIALFSYVDGGTSPLPASFEQALDMAFRTAGVEYYPELLGQPTDPLRAELVEKIRLVDPDFA